MKKIKQNIVIKINNGFKIIDFSHVLFCKADSKKIEIHLDNDDIYKINTSLSSLIEKLPEKFHKCHRSYIVNTKYIQKYINSSENLIVLFNNETIPVSRRHKNKLKQKINNLFHFRS